MQVFSIRIVVSHRNLYRYTVFLTFHSNHAPNDRNTVAIKIFHKFSKTFFRMKCLVYIVTLFVFISQVSKRHCDALVQISQLANTCRKSIVFKLSSLLKNSIIRQESNLSTALISVAQLFYWVESHPALILLLPYLTIAIYGSSQVIREGIHARYPYPVQTTRHFIRAFVELTTGTNFGHYHLQCRNAFFLVNIHRDTTPIILYGDRVILVNRNGYHIAIARQCLVYRVVKHFIHKVMQTAHAHIAYIHRGAHTHVLHTFERLDIIS